MSDDMTREEALTLVLSNVEELTEVGQQLFASGYPRAKKRPLLGGVFGGAGYLLCSCCLTVRGLQGVKYFVTTEHGLFLSGSETKAGAIDMARYFLLAMPPQDRAALVQKYRLRHEEREAAKYRAEAELQAEIRARSERPDQPKVKSIGRRRQRIFDASGGLCHYCSTALTLDGKWHVEHKMPRALGGDDEPGNLVASCVPCNMKKRDTTDLEFKAKRAKESPEAV